MFYRNDLEYVSGGDLEDRAVHVGAVGGERVQLLAVRLAVGEGRGEDGRVGRDADDVALGDQSLEAARGDALARQVVEPDAHAGLRQGGGGGVGAHDSGLLHARTHAEASDSFAAAMTASAVIPNSRNSVL